MYEGERWYSCQKCQHSVPDDEKDEWARLLIDDSL
ncbi:hypothetical protein F8388_014016 [Cannabis sativa]|uniref:Uncharacterized protein n=1 Tax=Cannabis sativa TaxID=3483 RepID=A0A7J6GKS1_CANSA|nr:hypothetical protein G4B88_028333 [Cannabis sativa]KAF4383516.1 hypothetical protein F8388_014016 [Cannabis sativa]